MQRRTVLPAGICALALLAGPAQASEVRAALGSWSYAFEGDVDDRGVRYDLDDDLELEARRGRNLAVEVDTPRGGWPDFAFTYAPMSARGDHSEEVGFPLPATRTISTDADFDSYDLVARWPLNRGALRLSAGLAVQQLTGELIIEDSQEGVRHERYDETFPQVHAQLRWVGRAFALAAVAQGIEYDGSRAMELRGMIEARFMAPLLVQAGWQQRSYEIDVADYALDARVSGALVRVGIIYR